MTRVDFLLYFAKSFMEKRLFAVSILALFVTHKVQIL